jgi:hypothetical protein
MGRKLVFLLMIIIGLAGGLLYGWVIRPAAQSDNPLSALRDDFKSDYVLMVAEVYNKDGDMNTAIQRLQQLNDGPALQAASNALVYARNAGYSIDDLQLISSMIQDMQGNTGAPTQPPAVITEQVTP